jgi:hypothetical protein
MLYFHFFIRTTFLFITKQYDPVYSMKAVNIITMSYCFIYIYIYSNFFVYVSHLQIKET